MKKAKKIKVFALAKLQAILLGLIGLLAGITYSFGGLIMDVLVSLGRVTTTETPGLSFGTVLAFGALMIMPVIGATVGFLPGIMEAILFNFVAVWLEGISTEL